MKFNYLPCWFRNCCVCNCSVTCFNYIETQNVNFAIWRWREGVIFELRSSLLGWDWGCCLCYCRPSEQCSEEPRRSSLMCLKTQMPLIRYGAMSGRRQRRCWEPGRKGKLWGVRFFFQLLLESRRSGIMVFKEDGGNFFVAHYLIKEVFFAQLCVQNTEYLALSSLWSIVLLSSCCFWDCKTTFKPDSKQVSF